ncbi:MAG: hypothetical protein FE048_00875 [Thermoplasmata archaeon]|nr:MAG: hypothetical protein FE048_00875 [Thermoplasmata archaeon]
MTAKGMKFVFAFGVALFLLTPAIISVSSGDMEEKVSVNCTVVKPTGKTLEVEKAISVKDAGRLSNECNEAAEAFKVFYDNTSSDEEREWAKEVIENTIKMMKELGILPEDYAINVNSLLCWPFGWLFGPSHGFDFLTPIVSIGSGCSWIPLYPGEAFLGVMLRPIFTFYLLGYTGSLSVNLLPPRIEYWDLVGPQAFVIWGFTGIYIDFGKIGLGIPNTQFIMGYCLLTAGISLL